jgi:hypothetical protein
MGTATATPTPTATAAVEAELNDLRNTGQRPVNYTFEPPPGVPRNSGVVDTRRVRIRNARLASSGDGLSLDRAGFELVAHRSALDGAPTTTPARRASARSTTPRSRRCCAR